MTPAPPREPEYSFGPFLDELSDDWYADDDLLQRLLARRVGPRADTDAKDGGPAFGGERDLPETAHEELSRWGREVAGWLRELAEESARPENRPRLEHFDARGRRVDDILLPRSTREALAVVEGREGLGAVSGDPFVHYAKGYLYGQNGEAGVACSMACTDGLVRALEALGDRPEHRRAAERVRGSTRQRVVHGAQFVTERQGGSDVGANRTRAVADGETRRLYGRKWFCSNVNADYYLVTARPQASADADPADAIGLYLVPARLEGERTRNGHTVDRLKDKLGTRELATAELTFDGALAHPVGPEERGMANLLRHVLVPSRFWCVSFCASALRRAERIVRAYAEFRTAFGRPIVDYPQVERTVERLARERARALACLFRLLDWWEADDGSTGTSPATGSGQGAVDPELAFRIMLSLGKAVLTRRTSRLLRQAVMVLAGNGIEERFSPLPRLLRDAIIMETWEGPYNVLLAQARRDLRRFEPDPEAFVEHVGGERAGDAAVGLADVLDAGEEADAVFAFEDVAERLVSGMGDRALDDCGFTP